MSKRVYKYLSARFALDDLDRSRLKVTTVDDLNDPFDLAGVDTKHPLVEEFQSEIILHMRRTVGLLCFSRNWDNILLWSHYGWSHTGICLGFDIPPDGQYDMEVLYQPSVLPFPNREDMNFEDFANKLLRTKYTIWSYEQELRMLVGLNDPPDEQGMN